MAVLVPGTVDRVACDDCLRNGRDRTRTVAVEVEPGAERAVRVTILEGCTWCAGSSVVLDR